jgi:hypothetical protein
MVRAADPMVRAADPLPAAFVGITRLRAAACVSQFASITMATSARGIIWVAVQVDGDDTAFGIARVQSAQAVLTEVATILGGRVEDGHASPGACYRVVFRNERLRLLGECLIAHDPRREPQQQTPHHTKKGAAA